MRIELRNLCKYYVDASRKLSVLEGVNFTFAENASTAILGRSGIGKSTLLHLLGGLDRPSEGEVLYAGSSLSPLSEEEMSAFRGENIGFIFQFHHLLPEFTAIENVAMPLTIAGESDGSARETAEELLLKVGLKERMEHRPGQLSGGEQQRVAIARALVRKPAVLLADEPTGNLDLETARVVQELILEMPRQYGATLILVTHNQELASLTDQVVEMQAGGSLEVR